MLFPQDVFHTHRHSFSISASFFLPDAASSKLAVHWNTKDHVGNVDATLDTVGIFLSLFFRLFFTCLSDLQSLVAAAEQWHLGNTQNCAQL